MENDETGGDILMLRLFFMRAVQLFNKIDRERSRLLRRPRSRRILLPRTTSWQPSFEIS